MGKNCGHTVPCGCADTGLFTPPPCGDGVECPDSNPCSETFDANCIYHTGQPILCGVDEVVATNMSLSDALAAVVAYFCATSGHELTQALICGEDTVAPVGSTLDEALRGIVSYFCGRLGTLETQVGNNTTALLNTVTSSSSCVTAPSGCTTCSISLTFRDNGNNIIDTVTLNLPEICPPTDVCAGPDGTILDGVTKVVVCNNGEQELVLVDNFALTKDLPEVCSFLTTEPNPLTDKVVMCRNNTDIINVSYQTILDVINATVAARGLFSQTTTSTPVQGVTNNAGSLFGTGIGGLFVPPDTFQVGDAFKLDGYGRMTMPSPPSSSELTIEVLFNGFVQLAIVMDMPQATAQQWSMEINFTIRSIGPSGLVATAIKFMHEEDANDKLSGHGLTQITALDTTILNTLDVRATWSTANDNREIYSQIMNLHKIY